MDGRLLKVINILTEELEYSKDLATESKLENLYLKDEIEKKDELIKNNLQLAVRMAKITVSNYEKQLLEKDKQIANLKAVIRGDAGTAAATGALLGETMALNPGAFKHLCANCMAPLKEDGWLCKVCGDTGAGGDASANGLKYGAAIGAAAGNIVCTPKEELKKEPGKVTPVLKEMEKKLKVFNLL